MAENELDEQEYLIPLAAAGYVGAVSEYKYVIQIGKGYLSHYSDQRVMYVLETSSKMEEERLMFNTIDEVINVARRTGGTIEMVRVNHDNENVEERSGGDDTEV